MPFQGTEEGGFEEIRGERESCEVSHIKQKEGAVLMHAKPHIRS